MRAHGDALFWSCVGAILVGWFLLDTLHVSVGPIEHAVRFYDFAAIIARPVRLLTGVGRHGLGSFSFALLCCASIGATLAPWFRRERHAALGAMAPLVLILACALLLYARSSGEVLMTSNDPTAISNDVFRFANDLLHRGGAVVARRVTIGAGAYLAFIGALVLALRGLAAWRGGRNPGEIR
jgi:hypothetical protein